MGNSLGAKKTAKVMRVSGEEFKVKAGVEAGQVVKDYPGHVLLESEAVKHYGIRAKPLEPNQELKAKRVYFLVELPKVTIRDSHNNVKVPRRVRSGINMSAKDRLENLMLARRSVSDLSLMKPMSILPEESPDNGTPMRVRMRLPKSEVEKLMKESRDEAEAAEKIVGLCLVRSSGNSVNNNVSGDVTGCHGRRDGVREGVKANQVWN
ncbi:plastid movement impaired protein [Parasponia andersonii]|uniref:Plastid movement impaired protein n=1 Tax=Parasponia andersonii TaxID=3476 RepID=A0A2P5DZK5_PARAD|nr:plastid movement impaired protein [Parasponia andersonii]